MIETLRTWRLLHDLEREARRPAAARAARQGRLLRAAVRHAYDRVPLYRRRWDEAGFDPDSVRDVGDLRRVPPLPHEVGRAARERGELLADGVDADRLPGFPTSGSSGRPLWVRRGPAEQRRWRAGALSIWREHGYRWRCVTAQLNAHAGPPHALQRLGLSRTAWISTELPVDEQARRLAEARAGVVVGSPTVLRRLADALGPGAVAPRIVFCHGEVLDSATSALLEEAFGVVPVGLYGLTELGYVAWQCEERGPYHVNAGTCLVEVMRGGRAARPGELGEVLVTDLCGRTSPLLRYETGDLAVAAQRGCRCGRPLPLLGSLEGRVRDAISLPGGRVVTTRAVVEHMAGVLAPDRYSLRQEGPARFRLGLRGAAEDGVVEHLAGLLGDVEVETVAGLPPGGSANKSRPVVAALTAGRPGSPARRAGRRAPSGP